MQKIWETSYKLGKSWEDMGISRFLCFCKKVLRGVFLGKSEKKRWILHFACDLLDK
jgi:hypothetical protein